MLEIKYTGRGLKLTQPIKDYVEEKLSKIENRLERALSIEVELAEISANKKASDDYLIEITVYMPNAIIRVEENDADMYAAIDKAEDVLRRRVDRYFDKLSSWENNVPWKKIETELIEDSLEDETMPEDPNTSWTEFEPKIVKKKQYSDNTPMPVEEAIERMELIGHNSFLFRNTETEKYTMVYKRLDGNYGLVEPKDV